MADASERRKVVRAACPHDCPDTCAMLVTVEDGRAVDVRGDPEHPFTRGGLCVKVNNYEQRVYSPERLLHPLKRSGPKGSGQFERIGWHEAMDTIRRRWTDIVDQFGATAILPYSYLGTEASSTASTSAMPFSTSLALPLASGLFAIRARARPTS